jgi:hypothetical protein
MFLQTLWQLRQGWDDEIPKDYQQEWSHWQKEVEDLHEFTVPRFYRVIGLSPRTLQLHVFGDASERAFCAVAYFRFEYSNGQKQCIFVAAKTRVAPIKSLSIPKLELQAAVLSARLADSIRREHDYDISTTHYWSDSSAVLGQICGESKRHPAFVANRLSEILETTEPEQWRHCPGKLNSADDGSRGRSSKALTPECRWLNGPAFLLLPEEQWPEDIPRIQLVPDKDGEELAETVLSTDDVDLKLKPEFMVLCTCSSLVKLCRVTAYVRRFIQNCRKDTERKIGPLEVQEIMEARLLWIKHAQKETFAPEICKLEAGKPILKKSQLITLTPFLDKDQVLRVGGRIGTAPVAYDVRHPIIIPQDHHLGHLIIMDCHKRLSHEGTEHVRNELKLVYWIPHSRSSVRKVLHKSSYCKRRRVKPQALLMASLPQDRLEPAPPFSKVGVDYFGPILVKHLRKQEKRYGCLFTCLVTRAVHLEVAKSIETYSFINALRRFIARRGSPTNIYSDNGTNFVGADRELKQSLTEWNQSKIAEYLSQKEIQWHFNPPGSPHFGGVWERLVQSCKKALKVVLHGQVISDDVLETAMVETEALVNSRPLTQVSSNVNDLEAITPNHFLMPCSNPAKPFGVFTEKEISSKKRWRQTQVIVNQVWRRWLREYLPTLMERKKWNVPMRSVKVGDLVLLVDERTHRGDWPLGRVTKTFSGKDDTVRVCEVK